MLQILAASTLPAATQFIGVRLPQNAGNEALAYIGLVALSFAVIRLFWAPYSMWKEQGCEIGALKLELSKPERMIVKQLAKKRAKLRLKLVNALRDLQGSGFGYSQKDEFGGSKHYIHAHHVAQNCGLSLEVLKAISFLYEAAKFRFENNLDSDWNQDLRCMMDIIEYVNNSITIEELLRRWPPGTEPEIQQ